MAVDAWRIARKRTSRCASVLMRARPYIPKPGFGSHAQRDRKAATFVVRSTVRVTPPNRSWRSQEWL